MHNAIRQLEYISLRAWQALEEKHYDGWLLRAAAGYTRRANSVQVLDPSSLPLTNKIAYCERWYAARGLPALFRLTDAAQPPQLETVLRERGYQPSTPTQVQVADLAAMPISRQGAFTCASQVSEIWLDRWARWNDVADAHRATAYTMLSRLPGDLCFGKMDTAAVGLAVREGNDIGLFDIVVDPQYRRQGYGRALVTHLLRWAQMQGASRAYLQVTPDNHAAQHLYAQLGFTVHHLYTYWSA